MLFRSKESIVAPYGVELTDPWRRPESNIQAVDWTFQLLLFSFCLTKLKHICVIYVYVSLWPLYSGRINVASHPAMGIGLEDVST